MDDSADAEENAFTRQFDEVCEKVSRVHEGIHSLGDGPSEVTLLRKCASACKVTHLLRAAGVNMNMASL